MLSKLKTPILLIPFVLVIYLMRSNEFSPGRFLGHQVSRILQEQLLSEEFCSDVDPNPVYSKGAYDRSRDYRSNIAGIRPSDESLIAKIERQEPKDDFIGNYIESMMPILVAWIVFFAIGLVGWIFCVSNWCCLNADCCRRRLHKLAETSSVCNVCCFPNPKSSKAQKIYTILTVIFITLTLLAGIAGLVVAATIPKRGHETVCSIIRFLDTAEYGSSEYNWVGIAPGVAGSEHLLVEVEHSVAGMSKFTNIFQGLSSALGNASTDVGLLYMQNEGVTLPRINPDITTPYEPQYIQDLGPANEAGTYTNLFTQELTGKGTAVKTLAAKFQEFSSHVTPQIAQMTSDTVAAIPNLIHVSDFVADTVDSPDNYKKIERIIKVLAGVVLGVSAIDILIGLIVLISIFFLVRGLKNPVKPINFSWFLLGIFMLLAWAASAIVFALSIAVAEVCDAGDLALKDPLFFNQTADEVYRVFDIHNKDGFNRTRHLLYQCVHGNGDMAEQFNIKNNLGVFDFIFEGVGSFSAANEAVLPLITGSRVLAQLEPGLNAYKLGVFPDSTVSATDLITLNSYTNPASPACTNVQDTWVLNSINCTTAMGTPLGPGASSDFNINNPTCIGLNVWASNNNRIAERYTAARFTGCGAVNSQSRDAYIRGYIDSLIANRQQANTVITNLQEDLAAVEGNYDAFDAGLLVLSESLAQVNTSAAGIFTSIVDPNKGLLAMSNCNYQKIDAQEILDVACIGLGPVLYRTTIVFLIISFMSSLATLVLFCLARRLKAKEIFEPSKARQYQPEMELPSKADKGVETSS